MSHHSDENLLIASSDSFWEPGNYKRTTKRIEDGYKLCNDLIALIQERADIEKSYAKSLKGWSKKWNELIEKGRSSGLNTGAADMAAYCTYLAVMLMYWKILYGLLRGYGWWRDDVYFLRINNV